MITEVLDAEVLNMIADFEEEVMRNEYEPSDDEAFDLFLKTYEMNGLFDEIYGG